MKTNNRIISILLSVVLLFTAFVTKSPAAKAAEARTNMRAAAPGDTFSYTHLGTNLDYLVLTVSGSKGTLQVTGNNSPSNSIITIPNEIVNDGISYNITKLGENSFLNNSSLTTINLPDTLEVIGLDAFKKCINLNNVVLPDSLHTLEQGAFNRCSALSNIKLPNSLQSIGIFAFERTALTSVMLPSSLDAIGGNVFESCNSLTSVVIPGNTTSVSSYAFTGCHNLREVIFLGETPPQIFPNAFLNTHSSIKASVPKGKVNDYIAAMQTPVHISNVEEMDYSGFRRSEPFPCDFGTILYGETTADLKVLTVSLSDCGYGYIYGNLSLDNNAFSIVGNSYVLVKAGETISVYVKVNSGLNAGSYSGNFNYTLMSEETITSVPLSIQIDKLPVTLENLPLGLSAIEGQSLSEISLGEIRAEYNGVPVPGIMAWDNESEILTIGTHSYTATFTPTNPNYHSVTESITLDVKITPLEPTVNPSSITTRKGDSSPVSIYLGQGSGKADSAKISLGNSSIASSNHTTVTTDKTIQITGLKKGNTTANITWTGGSKDGQTEYVNITVAPLFFNVTFDFAGGIHTGGGSILQSVEEGSTATAPTVSREGYTFMGWDSSLLPVTADITYTAVWKAITKPVDPPIPPVDPPIPPVDPPIPDTPSSVKAYSRSKSYNGSSTPDKMTVPAITFKPYNKSEFDKDFEKAIKEQSAEQLSVVIRAQNYSVIEDSVLDYAYKKATDKGLSVTLQFDTINEGVIVSRIYLTPKEVNKSVTLQKNDNVSSSLENSLSKFFSNKIKVLSYGDTPLKATIRAPKDISTENLTVYSFNKENNTYKKLTLKSTENGYLEINSPTGQLIFSDGELVKK